MSGFFTKLKNKVTYNANQLVDDPVANEQAAKEEDAKINEKMYKISNDPEFGKVWEELFKKVPSYMEKLKASGLSEEELRKRNENFTTDVMNRIKNIIKEGGSKNEVISEIKTIISELDEEIDNNSDEISFSRIVKKIWNYIKLIFEKGFFPFIAIILAMYVANEMIVYPAPIRIVFFIFVFVLCFLFKHVTILLGFFYLCKSGYDYYINNMAGGEKRRIMPRIYALLPVTTYRSESPLTAFFLSPFQYPKSKKDEEELVKVMEEYNNSLTESFAYLDKVKTLPFFVEGLKKISTNFEGMHTIVEGKTNEPPSSESKPNERKTNKPVPSESKPNEAPPLPLTIEQNIEKRAKEKENRITNAEFENRVKEETERLKRPLSINERNQIRKKIIENKTASAKPMEELPPSLPVNNTPKNNATLPPSLPVNNTPKNNATLPRTIEQNIEMRKKEEEAKEANKKVISEVEKLERPLTIEENKKLRSPSNTTNTKQNVKEEVTPSAPSEEPSAK